MNFRIISVVLLIILFALASTMLNISFSEGLSLNQAYNSGNIKIIQKTAAGTIPNEVDIINNGNVVLNAKKGNVLTSSVSQDLILAEDKEIAPNSTETVKAYCIEPSQRAVINSKLLPVNNTYNAVNQIISSSNPDDPQSAYNAQLEIYVIMSGGNLNPYTGEPVAVVETKQITWTQFRQDLANAKTNVLNTFNVNENNIQNLNQNVNSPTGIDTTVNNIKRYLGIR